MRRAVSRSSALAGLLVAGALGVGMVAVARAEVPEVRIGVQFSLFIAKDPAAAADIYISSESANIPKDQVADMLKDGTMVYSVAPSGVLKFATFMAKTGELKSAPKSWHDVFFPVLGFRRGS